MAAAARPSNGWCLYSPPFKAVLPSPHLGGIHPYGFPIPARNFDSVLVVVATLLARLRDGTAKFELLDDSALAHAPPVWPRLHCFARVAPSLRGGWSAALNKVEHYGVQRVTGDGRCMFRALAKGMAKNKGIPLAPREEVQDADDLRMAVKEIICDSETERQEYEEAVIAITVEQSLKRYCQRIRRPDFWGGESELLISSMLNLIDMIDKFMRRSYSTFVELLEVLAKIDGAEC
ncbi:unnamed protein product [Miscanthus lutarioriparius]|uniref:Ubiquitin thioesterase OTU n=1 Tax=Miscanthus lutarioriparius TaxID=422564 RepID=A0A811MPX7_9POAL|nr:unnamed protein product [Miscanthus lutarioriparius]